MRGAAARGDDVAPPRHRHDERGRDVDVGDVVANLRELDGNQVAQVVGIDFARQLTDSMRFFRLPLLRRLPAVRYILGPSGVPDPLGATARMGRILGDMLDSAQRAVNWFADLHGTITGPQFLDRVGLQLVTAAQRPAKRLILFGVLVAVLTGLIKLSQLSFLDPFAKTLWKFLSFPVLLLGGLCLIPLSLGAWFRKIAGQAADFYDRVAEAQFLSLTEMVKEAQADHDLRVIADRVLLPEATLRGGAVDGDVVQDGLIAAFENDADRATPLADRVDWATCDFVILFYRDFLDGSYFHKSDTKVANMLLGNVTLENIRQNRLQFTKKRLRKLDKIDIARGKGGVVGAYVWFHSITHAVSQHTARLIIEYNQHCIPADEIEAADPVDRRLFEEWLSRRLTMSVRARENDESWVAPSPDGEGNAEDGTLAYRTTEFNALHFLTADEKRDDAIRARYGEAVYHLILEDRENLVRMIFGTFPMQDLPKEKRTFNPYEFYRQYFARGRVFLFPLVALVFVGRGLRLLVRRLIEIVRDVLDPDTREVSEIRGRASFDVARRKIHRMRRPAVMEAVRLRADFDIQYLGLALPGRKPPDVAGQGLIADLRALDASEREWEEFRNVKSRRERQSRLLAHIFRVAQSRGRDFEAEIVARNPRLKGREAVALRAVATAFVCDHDAVCSIATAFEELGALRKRLASRSHPPPRFKAPTPRRRRVTRLVDDCWSILAPGAAADDPTKDDLVEAILRDHAEQEASLVTLAEELPAGRDPLMHAFDELLLVGEQPSSWSEQIVAVRTVQTLGMLDISGYEKMIEQLGNYQDHERSERRIGDVTRRL